MGVVVSKEEIAEYVENLVLHQEMSYLEACLDAMDQFHLDYSSLARSLLPALKSKLESEVSKDGMLKNSSKPAVTF